MESRLYYVADYDFFENRTLARALGHLTPEGSSLFVWGFESDVYFTARRKPASRFIYDVPQLFGAGINTVSLIGIVILIGIVDNDAVVKIDFINQLRREGMATRAAIMEAGRHRLRPIVMNTITTMLAILPMMLGLGAGAGLQAPLAIAVFGGLFTSTILTLLVIPVVYEMVDDLRIRLFARHERMAHVEVRPAPAESLAKAGLHVAERAGGD
jgi:hypothetical protein